MTGGLQYALELLSEPLHSVRHSTNLRVNRKPSVTRVLSIYGEQYLEGRLLAGVIKVPKPEQSEQDGC